jgi:hypothetical protein
MTAARARLPNRRGSVIVSFEHAGQRYRASGSFYPHNGQTDARAHKAPFPPRQRRDDGGNPTDGEQHVEAAD